MAWRISTSHCTVASTCVRPGWPRLPDSQLAGISASSRQKAAVSSSMNLWHSSLLPLASPWLSANLTRLFGRETAMALAVATRWWNCSTSSSAGFLSTVVACLRRAESVWAWYWALEVCRAARTALVAACTGAGPGATRRRVATSRAEARVAGSSLWGSVTTRVTSRLLRAVTTTLSTGVRQGREIGRAHV